MLGKSVFRAGFGTFHDLDARRRSGSRRRLAQARRAGVGGRGGWLARQRSRRLCAAADRRGGRVHRRGQRAPARLGGRARHRRRDNRRAMVAVAAAHRRGPQRVPAARGRRVAARAAARGLPAHGGRIRRGLSARGALQAGLERLLARQRARARLCVFGRRRVAQIRSVARGDARSTFPIRSGCGSASSTSSATTGTPPRPTCIASTATAASTWGSRAGISPCRGSRSFGCRRPMWAANCAGAAICCGKPPAAISRCGAATVAAPSRPPTPAAACSASPSSPARSPCA